MLSDTGAFLPHGSCFLWQTNLVRLHVFSNSLIAISYFSIPILLFIFVRKRKDLPFNWIFLLFAAFIISCGINHALEIWTLWHPDYWFSGFAKLITALVSAYTAFQLIYLLPQALALPSPEELKIANQALEIEVKEREIAQKELQEYKENLEKIVEQRTAELATANLQMEAEIQEKEASKARLAETLLEVEEINQDLDAFAYVASHDLKAPLRGINSLASWLLEDYYQVLDSRGQEFLDLLMSRVQKMHTLIDGVLQYSRLGRLEEEKQEVDCNILLAEVTELLAPPENIEIKITSQLPYLSTQKIRLQQVFQNLLSNAIRFTNKPNGKIEIGCREKKEAWLFWIKDNGEGIRLEFQQKIFQMFQSISSQENESTGIGLAVVKKIVEGQGGKIWLESEEGKGSTFYWMLPKVESKITFSSPIGGATQTV